jgi:hypothetical protein
VSSPTATWHFSIFQNLNKKIKLPFGLIALFSNSGIDGIIPVNGFLFRFFILMPHP